MRWLGERQRTSSFFGFVAEPTSSWPIGGRSCKLGQRRGPLLSGLVVGVPRGCVGVRDVWAAVSLTVGSVVSRRVVRARACSWSSAIRAGLGLVAGAVAFAVDALGDGLVLKESGGEEESPVDPGEGVHPGLDAVGGEDLIVR
jgi:hypothetical protein